MKINDGQTLLDYFAAHAPTEPQSWFEPDFDESQCPPEPDPDYFYLEQLGAYDSGEPMVRSQAVVPEEVASEVDRVQSFRKAWADWQRAYGEHRLKRVEACLKQWPYAWAKAQLAERQRLEEIDEGARDEYRNNLHFETLQGDEQS